MANIGEPMRRHHVIPLDHPIPATTEPTPLLITGDKTRDAALGEPRIRAGEIIGWRFWKLCHGLLQSVVVSFTWHPGIFERSSSKYCGHNNLGYHAFRDKVQAEHRMSPVRRNALLSAKPAKTRRSISSKIVRSVIGYAIRPPSAKSLRSLSNTLALICMSSLI